MAGPVDRATPARVAVRWHQPEAAPLAGSPVSATKPAAPLPGPVATRGPAPVARRKRAHPS